MRWILFIIILFSLTNRANTASEEIASQKDQSAVPKAAEGKTPLAVLDIETHDGVDPGFRMGISDRVRYVLSKTEKYRIISRNSMESLLKEQDFQQSGRCNDLMCIVKVGKVVGVKKMVAGRVAKMGSLYQLSLQLIDVESSVIENDVIDSCKCDEEGLLQLAEEQAYLLTGLRGRSSKRASNAMSSTNQAQLSQAPEEPWQQASPIYDKELRYRLADMQLGGVVGFYRQFNDPPTVQAVRCWDNGVRVSNISRFERRDLPGRSWTIVYAGTETATDGHDIRLTTDK